MTKTQSGKSRASGRITLAMVAEKACVATMTASRAITQPEMVSQALRDRVDAAVAELGYVPNRAARALASSQSKVIAVLVPSLSNAVFTEVLAGIQDALDGFAARQASATGASTFDATMPARGVWRGSLHPVTLVIDEICEIFRELGFTIAVEPEGAFYLYADISQFGGDAFAFCRHFLETEHVAFTPGLDFGRYQAGHHVRFAYTQNLPRLQEAVERIARGLKSWQG